jgi:hypothetical protein
MSSMMTLDAKYGLRGYLKWPVISAKALYGGIKNTHAGMQQNLIEQGNHPSGLSF